MLFSRCKHMSETLQRRGSTCNSSSIFAFCATMTSPRFRRVGKLSVRGQSQLAGVRPSNRGKWRVVTMHWQRHVYIYMRMAEVAFVYVNSKKGVYIRFEWQIALDEANRVLPLFVSSRFVSYVGFSLCYVAITMHRTTN